LSLSVIWAQAASAALLVDIDWLVEHLNDPDVVLIDMSSDQLQYQRFHIPGAVYLPYEALVTTRRDGVSVAVSRERLYALLGQLGIKRTSHVVIYDDLGGLNAARLFWELERIGHPRISLVDGGLVKWILSGRTVTADPTLPRATRYEASPGPTRDNLAELDDVIAARDQNSSILLDVRTQEEYSGNPKHRRSGHIPGAHWWEWQNAVAFDQAFTQKSEPAVTSLLEQLGLKDDSTPVVLYCRTGHRASHTYFTLRRLGFENIKVYDASMFEYAGRKEQPLQLGPRP
jgi:thiosulfate/3-mercaptopyruvate sulfurtransferase